MDDGLKVKRIFSVIAKVIDIVPEGGAYVAFSFIAVSTIADVFMRYVLNSPIRGVVESNTLLLPVLVFLGLAATQRSRRHIRVNVLIMRLTPRAQLALEIGVLALAFVFVFVMGLQALKDAVLARSMHQVMFGTLPPIPTFPFKLLLPVGLWLFCLQYMRDIANNVARLKVRELIPYERRVVEGEEI